MTREEAVQSAINRHTQLKGNKQPWLDLWQLLGEYIHMRRMDFTTVKQPGDFLTREIFDSTAPKACKTASSTVLSMLWPQSVKRLRLTPPESLPDTAEIKSYYEKITRKLISVMDNPKAGLPMALEEYMLDQFAFGTSGVEIMRDKKTKLCYKAWGVKNLSIAEDQYGFVDTVYIEINLPVHILVKTYGLETVSSKIRDLYKKKKYDQEFTILIAIEPRMLEENETPKKGNLGMPFRSLHIEVETKNALKESGFTEMPIKVARFWKILGEIYGRCPGMDALPSALEANAVWEAVTVAIEKNLDPPLGVLDDGKLGGGAIDTSAGAINVFNISGKAGEKNPIFPLYTVGEVKQSVNLLEQLAKDISDHFFIDRLLDFNNETRMTLGEANIRNRLRNSTLSSIFTRQIAELFTPIVERSFNLLFEDGEFGVIKDSVDHRLAELEKEEEPFLIPDEVSKLILQGKNVYNIEYFTPALRIMQAEEANGILQSIEAAQMMSAAGFGQVNDNINSDKALTLYSKITGAPSEILYSTREIAIIRDERDKQLKAAQQLEQLKAMSEMARNTGQSGLVPTQAPARSGVAIAA